MSCTKKDEQVTRLLLTVCLYCRVPKDQIPSFNLSICIYNKVILFFDRNCKSRNILSYVCSFKCGRCVDFKRVFSSTVADSWILSECLLYVCVKMCIVISSKYTLGCFQNPRTIMVLNILIYY